jgi:hypothetical protein
MHCVSLPLTPYIIYSGNILLYPKSKSATSTKAFRGFLCFKPEAGVASSNRPHKPPPKPAPTHYSYHFTARGHITFRKFE